MGFLSACRTFGRLHAAKRRFDTEKEKRPLTYRSMAGLELLVKNASFSSTGAGCA